MLACGSVCLPLLTEDEVFQFWNLFPWPSQRSLERTELFTGISLLSPWRQRINLSELSKWLWAINDNSDADNDCSDCNNSHRYNNSRQLTAASTKRKCWRGSRLSWQILESWRCRSIFHWTQVCFKIKLNLKNGGDCLRGCIFVYQQTVWPNELKFGMDNRIKLQAPPGLDSPKTGFQGLFSPKNAFLRQICSG